MLELYQYLQNHQCLIKYWFINIKYSVQYSAQYYLSVITSTRETFVQYWSPKRRLQKVEEIFSGYWVLLNKRQKLSWRSPFRGLTLFVPYKSLKCSLKLFLHNRIHATLSSTLLLCGDFLWSGKTLIRWNKLINLSQPLKLSSRSKYMET